MSDWKQRATELRKQGWRGVQIAKELGLSQSAVSRFLNYGDKPSAKPCEEPSWDDDDFIAIREPRVPKRIIKGAKDIMALAKQFAAGEITRSELMHGIAA